MSMSKRTAKKIGVSFLPETEVIIRRVDREMAMHNFSGALRFIVHDWSRLRGMADVVEHGDSIALRFDVIDAARWVKKQAQERAAESPSTRINSDLVDFLDGGGTPDSQSGREREE